MLQNPCKTLGFKKNMVSEIPPGGGGKPYPASGLISLQIMILCTKMQPSYCKALDIWSIEVLQKTDIFAQANFCSLLNFHYRTHVHRETICSHRYGANYFL